jgi:hypothetical protein
MDAFKTFEPALKSGELRVEPGTIDPELIVHMDMPNGQIRITYARMRGQSVSSIVIITPAEYENGLPVYQIGYAVAQHLRKRGVGKEIAQAAVREFIGGMARNGIVNFYLEAVVGANNIASQKIAKHVIGGEPKEIADHNSGEAAFQYMMEIGNGENRQPLL